MFYFLILFVAGTAAQAVDKYLPYRCTQPSWATRGLTRPRVPGVSIGAHITSAMLCVAPTWRAYYDKHTGRCINFRGCNDTPSPYDNNFESVSECEDTCLNSTRLTPVTPKIIDACNHKTYNDGRRKCFMDQCNLRCGGEKIQNYTGKYRTMKGTKPYDQNCRVACKKETGVLNQDLPRQCYLPREEGWWCNGGAEMLLRFYYDKNTKQCKEFTYRSCGGNGNNFPSKRECEDTCPKCPIPVPGYIIEKCKDKLGRRQRCLERQCNRRWGKWGGNEDADEKCEKACIEEGLEIILTRERRLL